MKKRTILWFSPAIIILVGISLLSTVLTLPIQAASIDYSDKLEHGFAYFVLVLAFLLAFHKTYGLTLQLKLRVVAAASLYGLLMEIFQYAFFPGRYFEWADALANVCGVLLGALFFKWGSRG